MGGVLKRARVSFERRLTNEEVNDIPIEDGKLIVTKEGKLFIDYEDERKEIGNIPKGGTTGQVLAKKSGVDNDTEWVEQTGGSIDSGDFIADNLDENSTDKAPSQRAVNDAFSTHGEIVKLETFDEASFTTKTVENINNFKLLLWQCCPKGQDQRVLGSVIGTPEQLKKCNSSGYTWQATFTGEPSNYLCELYYESDTKLIGRRLGAYGMGVLYGIRK